MDIEQSVIAKGTPGLPLPNELMVVFGPHGGAAVMLDLAARLSMRGQVYLLDCGNRSNMYRVASTLRFLTNDPVAMLRNIRLSRAFTCYQVVVLLEKLTLSPIFPVLILDLLATFMDESVHTAESSVLFDTAMQHLQVVSRSAPVVVSAKPLFSISAPRFGLLDQLKREAFQVWEEVALPAPGISGQLPLFVD